MNLLITGSCGHIGSYLIQNINKIKKIKNIYLIDNFLSEKVSTLFNLKSKKKIFFFRRDLTKKNSLFGLPNIEVAIHLASMTNAAQSFENKKKMFYNNFNSFKNILNFCIKKKTKLIHISSTSVYGKSDRLVFEDGPEEFLKPQSPYAEIKIKEEQLLKKYSSKLRYVTFRFGTIAGVSKGMRFHTAVNSFCLNAAINEKINIYKTAKNQFRPYLSIRDSFKIFKFCIEKDFFDNDIYNALTGNYTVSQIIEIIKKIKKKLKIKYVNSKIMNQLSYHVDNKKLSKKGLFLNSKIETDIKNTMKLFNGFNDL